MINNIIDFVYYINPDAYAHRVEAINNVVNALDTKQSYRVNVSKGNNSIEKCGYAHIHSIDKIINNNTYPALILEDDAEFINKDWKYVDVVADIVYLGGSTYPSFNSLRLEDYNDNYYRVYNMLSLHAYIVMNKNTAERLRDIYIKSTSISEHIDLAVARASKDLVCVTPKQSPYFYQNDAYNIGVTKFKWLDYI